MNDDIPLIILIILFSLLAGLGVAHLVLDFRNFESIVVECEKQGHIQNKVIRIKCAKEGV